jgi:pyruvate/2-oxoglutarate dehydrogenase complex dihydrolipoamide acyltransferase (E2) component
MFDRFRLCSAPGRPSAGAIFAVAALIGMIAVAPGRSQSAPAAPAAAQPAAPDQPASPQSPPAAAPAAPENPGLINEMGKVLEKSLSILPTLKGTGDALDDLNTRAKDAAKDAGESLSRLAKPASVASGRIVCPASANGAPDCKVAADKLCVAKGFKEGKSLTTDAVEACSAKVLIPGRARKPDDCRTDNYVTAALCQ